jgi:hypothetical protein
MKTQDILRLLQVCDGAIEWAEQYPDPKDAWDNCPKMEWLLWMVERVEMDVKPLFIVKGIMAHSVIEYMTDQRSRNAVRAAFLYGRGKITEDELEDAAFAAVDVYNDHNSAAADAAYNDHNSAAADAAYAAYCAVRTLIHTTDIDNAVCSTLNTAAYAAASTAADAADFEAADAAYSKSAEHSLAICKKVLKKEIFKKLRI